MTSYLVKLSVKTCLFIFFRHLFLKDCWYSSMTKPIFALVLLIFVICIYMKNKKQLCLSKRYFRLNWYFLFSFKSRSHKYLRRHRRFCRTVFGHYCKMQILTSYFFNQVKISNFLFAFSMVALEH